MSAATNGTRPIADFWFDPTCPWAWMTSRWMIEVQKVRDIDVRWNVMSLSVLNEGRDVSDNYRQAMDRAWLPVRVVTAARERHGDEYVGRLYTAIGERLHPGGEKDLRKAVTEALDEVGLSADLIEFGDTDTFDEQLRASHHAGISRVGDQVGTPVIGFGDTAFFGPVVTPAPKGEAAGKLWDGVLAVAETPGFYEIKRSREKGPQFD